VQTKPLHDGVVVLQMPLPQVCRVSVPAEQLVAPQEVPSVAMHELTPTPPLQLSLTQLGTSAVHSPFGSEPALAATHVVPAPFTTWHFAEQLTPTAAQRLPLCAGWQLPLVHWMLPVQTEPLPSVDVQVPAPEPVQKKPDAQPVPVPVLQLMPHALPEHA
jgi:hypothetical protein